MSILFRRYKTHILHTLTVDAIRYSPIELKVARENIIKTTKCNRDVKKIASARTNLK